MTEQPSISVVEFVETHLMPGGSPAWLVVSDRSGWNTAAKSRCQVVADQAGSRGVGCSKRDLLLLAADMLGSDCRNTGWVIQADPEVGLKCVVFIAGKKIGREMAFV